jgi:outer membrane receptor protein involved in Fe transport
VTTPEKIARETLLSIQDVYARTANLSDTYGSSGFTIRGITNSGVGGGGQADTASVYVDGAPIPRQALYGGPTDLWDVQQVEVLRGPQSTIQGLNALAGGIVITTRDPSLDRWSGDARVLWTDRNDRTFSAALGGPLIADELGLRLSAERRANRGVIRNVTRGGYDDAMESLNLRGKLKWTPSALPGVEAVASYNRVRREGGISINMPAPTCPIITTTGRPPPINPIAAGLPTTLPCSSWACRWPMASSCRARHHGTARACSQWQTPTIPPPISPRSTISIVSRP